VLVQLQLSLANVQLRDLTRERQAVYLDKEKIEKEELRKAQLTLDQINRDREKCRQRVLVRHSIRKEGITCSRYHPPFSLSLPPPALKRPFACSLILCRRCARSPVLRQWAARATRRRATGWAPPTAPPTPVMPTNPSPPACRGSTRPQVRKRQEEECPFKILGCRSS
jgi:hypothetical protein